MCAPHHLGPVCAQCDAGYFDWGFGCQGTIHRIIFSNRIAYNNIACSSPSALILTVGVIFCIGVVIWFHRSAGSVSGFLSVCIFPLRVLSEDVINYLSNR